MTPAETAVIKLGGADCAPEGIEPLAHMVERAKVVGSTEEGSRAPSLTTAQPVRQVLATFAAARWSSASRAVPVDDGSKVHWVR